MLENWLKPVPLEFLLENTSSKKFHIVKNINVYTTIVPSLTKTQVAIIGTHEETANVIRKYFYALAFHFPAVEIVDLGNLISNKIDFAAALLHELLQSHIVPILIGKNAQDIVAQSQAHFMSKSPYNVAFIDEKVDFTAKGSNQVDDDYFSNIVKKHQRLLFHIGILGYQSCLNDAAMLNFFDKKNIDHLRIGRVRMDMEEAETMLRDADMLAFNLAAIRGADAMAVANVSPNGLTAEEACQLSRYAGLSDKLTSFGIFGYEPSSDVHGLTAQLAAQMMWYFLDGFYHRKKDYPMSLNGLQEYIVDFKEHQQPITFWKSTKSNRWWVQVVSKPKAKLERHRLVPCTYRDYLLACKEELSDRVLKALNRFG